MSMRFCSNLFSGCFPHVYHIFFQLILDKLLSLQQQTHFVHAVDDDVDDNNYILFR